MSRYIDADSVWQTLPDDLPFKASVRRVLMQAPTVDAVEVIRCKDCIFCKDLFPWDGLHRRFCTYRGDKIVEVDADHYCGYGERRDNDGEIH